MTRMYSSVRLLIRPIVILAPMFLIVAACSGTDNSTAQQQRKSASGSSQSSHLSSADRGNSMSQQGPASTIVPQSENAHSAPDEGDFGQPGYYGCDPTGRPKEAIPTDLVGHSTDGLFNGINLGTNWYRIEEDDENGTLITDFHRIFPTSSSVATIVNVPDAGKLVVPCATTLKLWLRPVS